MRAERGARTILTRRPAMTIGALAAALIAGGVGAEPSVVTCTLQRSGTEFKGTCDVPCQVNALAVDFDGVRPKFACSDPARRVTASLRQTQTPGDWIGDMQGRQPEDPTRFEIVASGGGAAPAAKIPFGWFPVQSLRLDGDTLALTIAAERQLPPTTDDIRIIDRAIALLTAATWNKNDDRTCPPNPARWSLFCALMQATDEISGGIHYRQPALQAVREVLNEIGGNRFGKHRLMDYNNHPDTTLTEVHDLLRTAQTRLKQRVR
jgi:hypothetical protein